MKVLMIGNGIAALSAAESFRKFNTEAEVLILSTDQYPTYYRLKLSHYLAKDGLKIIILIGGGTKKGQQKDIDEAVALWEDYKRRKAQTKKKERELWH